MRHLLFAAAALAALASPASAETIAITGGKLVIGDGSAPIEGGTVVIRDGNVVAAGAGVAIPANARTIDASGKWVTPGVFAGFSRLGLSEVDAVNGTNDKSGGKSGFSAAIDVAPAIDPFRSPIAVNRSAGVTRAVVAPEAAGNIFAGQGAVMDLGSDSDAVTKARVFQFVELGENGAAAAGGSRSSSHLLFRAMLREAQDYATGRNAFDDELLRAEDAKALQAVLRGEQRLLVRVEAANDILRVLELKRDYPAIKMVLVGVSEGWRVADRIAAAGVPVIASALNDLPATFELLGATQSNIGRMKDAGYGIEWGPGRHGPGDNAFKYFIGPFDVVIEYTAEVQQIDDSYVAGQPADWTWPPGRVDQWGIGVPPTPRLKEAQRAITFVPA